jgi:hypothetical protein
LGLIDEIHDVREKKVKAEATPEVKAHLPIGQIMAKISALLLDHDVRQ